MLRERQEAHVSERRELKPIGRPAVIDPSWKKWHFPITPRDSAKQGNIDFTCPHCGHLLVKGTNGDVSDMDPTECSSCRQGSRGPEALSKA